MVQSLANLIAIVVVGVIVMRRGRDHRVEAIPTARWLRIAALIPLGFQLAFYLVFGIGEMLSGELSGAAHLLPAAAILILGILAWMRPLEGGAALIAVAALMIIVTMTSLLDPARPPSSLLSPMITLVAAPQLFSGGLFLSAGLVARRAKALHSSGIRLN